eukprot:8246707-Karenia_brevis.AAC.1
MWRVKSELVDIVRRAAPAVIGDPSHDPDWVDIAPKLPKRAPVTSTISDMLDTKTFTATPQHVFSPEIFP